MNGYDLQALNRSDYESFVQFINDKINDSGLPYKLLKLNDSSRKITLSELFISINNQLENNNKLIILIDEVEILLESNESKQIFRNLRSIMQSCSNICFIIAGADSWHKEIKDKTSPIVNNVQTFYLKSPIQFPIENYLIKNPLENYLAGIDINQIAKIVIEWTECKPWYVQAVCQAIIEIYEEFGQLQNDWQILAIKKVEDSVETTLDRFYSCDNSNNLSGKILILLANKPNLTIKEIAHMIGSSERVVWDIIDDLESLDKVRKKGLKYRIAGTIIEKWRQKTKDINFIKSHPSELKKVLVKFTFVIVFLIFSAITYFYANPPLRYFDFDFDRGTLSLEIPSLLEENESGMAKILIQNKSKTKLTSLNLIFNSQNIDYEHDGTGLLKLNSIDVGETKSLKLNFISRTLLSKKSFTSEVSIFHDAAKSPSKFSFNISVRLLPIKRYWGLISLLFVTISGFVAKPDVPQLITNLVSGLLKPQNDSKN